MRICFIVDARSPIARSWVDYFIRRKYEVHVISTYPCSSGAYGGAETYQVPFAFSKLSRVSHAGNVTTKKTRTLLSPLLASVRSGSLSQVPLAAHLWLTPIELRRHVQPTRDLMARISPDIVHAMRIPFEGILAAEAASPRTPLLISVWGNDF
ncbi:MAG TPA: hypothetical protein VNI02_22525, partial [Blastocatellia bacterium]|nr:hypothetical protein [Blastocatellia bacterium]